MIAGVRVGAQCQQARSLDARARCEQRGHMRSQVHPGLASEAPQCQGEAPYPVRPDRGATILASVVCRITRLYCHKEQQKQAWPEGSAEQQKQAWQRDQRSTPCS